jgi:hypothetical protein
MTVGPGITPGLLTLPTHTAQAVRVTKRSRAMRIARNYRRWGVAPRPENVAPRFLAAESFYHIFLNGASLLSDDLNRIFRWFAQVYLVWILDYRVR